MLGDWILTKLSGEFVTDASLGSSSGMFDLARRDWSDRVLEICGLDRAVFPPVVEPGTVIGAVTRAPPRRPGFGPARRWSSAAPTPSSAFSASASPAPGRFTIVGGSFWQTTMVLDEPLIDPAARLRTLCHATPGRWMIEGIGFYCGIVMRWFRDAFCELEQARGGSTRASTSTR